MTQPIRAATKYQKQLKKQNLEFAFTSLGPYSLPNGPAYSWATVTKGEDKSAVYPITNMTACRETASAALGDANLGLESCVYHRKQTDTDRGYIRYPLNVYMGEGHPVVMLLYGHDAEKIKKGLHVVWEYERLARCGERTKVYNVEHDLTVGRIDSPYKGKITLVVAPEFWGRAIPFISIFLLLLRLINTRVPKKGQTVHEYLLSMQNIGNTIRSDYSHVKKLYGTDGHTMNTIVRHWRTLAKAIHKWERFQGHFGASVITDSLYQLNSTSSAGKKGKANETKLRALVGNVHWKFALTLAKYLGPELTKSIRARDKEYALKMHKYFLLRADAYSDVPERKRSYENYMREARKWKKKANSL